MFSAWPNLRAFRSSTRVQRTRPLILLVLASACWGTGTVLSKRAVDEIPPLALLPIQLIVSAGALSLLLVFRRINVTWSPGLKRLGALGVLNPGVAYALGLLGLASIDASLAVLLWALEPVLILVLSRWLLGDRLSRPMVVAMILATIGVLPIVYQAGPSGNLVGVTLTLSAVSTCAIYTVLCRRLLADDAAISVVLVQQVAALLFAIALAGIAIVVGFRWSWSSISTTAWLSAAASGLMYYAMAFCFYLLGLQKVTASVAGAFLTLIPVFGVATGQLLLQEHLSRQQIFGMGVVLAAVAAIALLQTQSTSKAGHTQRASPTA